MMNNVCTVHEKKYDARPEMKKKKRLKKKNKKKNTRKISKINNKCRHHDAQGQPSRHPWPIAVQLPFNPQCVLTYRKRQKNLEKKIGLKFKKFWV